MSSLSGGGLRLRSQWGVSTFRVVFGEIARITRVPEPHSSDSMAVSEANNVAIPPPVAAPLSYNNRSGRVACELARRRELGSHAARDWPTAWCWP